MTLDEQPVAIRIKRLSHIALGVRDLNRHVEFYVGACGLKTVYEQSPHVYLRAVGSHHHVLELIGDKKELNHVSFEIADDRELDRAVEILGKQNIQIALGPERGVEPGLGRALRFHDPEGNTIELVSEVADIQDGYDTGAVKLNR